MKIQQILCRIWQKEIGLLQASFLKAHSDTDFVRICKPANDRPASTAQQLE
ncbi:hypothetical protein [Hymenobacter qilianensis]|uniref:Uncharacterized protein n=1 Tax=Hymenobacter qilianensis TaxID=1385715 RepID=A0A7H0GVF5_9BACT|nr:hypothetical protein [Hymenobacter qilianensis]QNP52271.1 hypothetical protein H9L05_00105 [Hymenobacter qilianensis]